MLSIPNTLVSWYNCVHPPSVDDFLNMLHDCRTSQNACHAKHVQTHLHNHGLESHEALGNHLVSTLMHCGSATHADMAFHKLVHRNEHSWTCLIQGHADSSNPEHAFDLFQNMKEDGLRPSSHTFVALLKACAKLKHLINGRDLHSELIKEALESEHFVGNTLVDMYAKCGSLMEAQKVFDHLMDRNVVSWSALIKGYADYGHAKEALDCLTEMQSEDLQLDSVTHVCCLRACRIIGAIDRGQQIHTQIVKDGFEKEPHVGNVLVDLYSKIGLFAEALDVFEELQARTLISWTALIAGYTEHGHGEEALNCLEQMQLAGLSPDAVIFVCSLKACSIARVTEKGLYFYSEMVKEGFERNPCAGTAFVDMCAKCGLLVEAQEGFDELSVQDVISWNTLIIAYMEYGQDQEALNRIKQMEAQGVMLNTATYVSALKASSCLKAIDKGREIHGEIAKEGYETESFIRSSLIDMYAKANLLTEAKEVFDEVQVHDVVSWNTLITGYIQHEYWEIALECLEHMQREEVSPDAITFVCSLQACGGREDIDKAREIHTNIAKEGFENNLMVGNALVDTYAKCSSLVEAWGIFECLPARDIISWNAMILGYAEQGETSISLQLCTQMQEQGMMPDMLTFVSLLKACGNAVAIGTGQRIHGQVLQVNGVDNDKMFLGAALIDMYCKCGSMVDAQKVFDTLPERDLVRWTALMNGYARHGASDVVFEMFEKMVQEGLEPNQMTFLSLFVACHHMGLLNKGKEFYEVMCRDYNITHSLEHQNCIVDLFGRVCQLDEAMALLETSSLQTSHVTWNSVLGSCDKWGNTKHHRHAFDYAVEVDEINARAFVLMSNLSAERHLFQDAVT